MTADMIFQPPTTPLTTNETTHNTTPAPALARSVVGILISRRTDGTQANRTQVMPEMRA